ncbi:hypothetical protein GJAV_G00005250 [Gymnothorax javanicus]|nr:hypothetical protein GJAV_G00005250 [Gymnothorax javanicus]
MKILATLPLVCVLFCRVYSLDCFMCIPVGTAPCTPQQTTCLASQTKCASVTAEVFAGQSQSTVNVGTCAEPTQCLNGSLNLGTYRTTVSTMCCDTNLCNSQYPPALTESSPNGRKCFTCLTEACSEALECKGPEDRCFTAVSSGGVNLTLKGCASQSVCSGLVNAQIGNIFVNSSCCEGNMCNNAQHIRQRISFLALVPLVHFILFS